MIRWLPWALLGAAIAGGLWVAYRLNVATEAEAELRRAAEGELLEQHGITVELLVRADQAEARERAAVAALPVLREAIVRARAAAPGSRVVEVVEGRSRPLVAGGEPRAPEPPDTPAPPCLVALGDRLELRSSGVTLQYRAGSRVRVVAGEAWRVDPGPPTRIVAGELVVSSAAVEVSRLPALARWGFGGAVFGGPSGLAYGVSVAAPPLRVLGLQLELVVGGGVGAGGAQGAALLLGRL